MKKTKNIIKISITKKFSILKDNISVVHVIFIIFYKKKLLKCIDYFLKKYIRILIQIRKERCKGACVDFQSCRFLKELIWLVAGFMLITLDR